MIKGPFYVRFCLVILTNWIAQFSAQQLSVTQEQLEYYNSLGNAEASYYESTVLPAEKPVRTKATCNLNKIVYGWHPYWSGSAYLNYDWDLLSHMSFFSYEVDAATGNANSTHGWSTSAAVTTALATGNTKVTLCVTLFSNHTTFFGSTSSQQTLITNLINLIQSRGAHGVNIDFEGLPSSQKTNFANFMVNLANQMHSAIPGSEVSTVLYAVDWNDVFDFTIMNQAVDHYIIMGYDYYWTNSTTAGPNDPLYHFGSTYNYTLSRSITYYLQKGCPANKLIMGLPYYGREWPTSSSTIPSSTTGGGVSRTYAYVKNNSTGYYTAANHQWETDSYSDVYVFNNGGPRQCFITLEDGFKKRLDHVNVSGIAGIGIWALGYDDGYNQLWNALEEYMTTCYSSPCPGTIHDFGGPTKNYYDRENYTWTIAPAGATSLEFTFTQFDVELNYDYLYIYDGPGTGSPQLSGSPFTGTNSPGTFTSSTGAVTFRFTSDNATTKPGFVANYTCANDVVAPVSIVSTPQGWKTQDFSATITDSDETDGSGLDKRFYQVLDFDGADWRANAQNGFFSDNFDQSAIHPEWAVASGSWSLTNGYLHQSDQANTNTNIFAALNQNNHNQWLHNFALKIGGTGTNRRAGYHFMCDDGSLPNRGNSYFVWFRADNDKIQIYKVTNDVFSLQADIAYPIEHSQWYTVDVSYDKLTGEIDVWLDNSIAASWTDPSPLTSGNAISFRSGDCTLEANNLKVYHNHTGNPVITIGNPAGDLRYQNTQPSVAGGRVKSLAIDVAKNISAVSFEDVNVDWTPPIGLSSVNDGLSTDIDIVNITTQLSANWSSANDPHSGIAGYEYAIGSSAYGTDVLNWTDNGVNTSVTVTGLNLNYGTTYYYSVRAINGAGLITSAISSDGALLEEPNQPPVAQFEVNNLIICEGDSIQLINTSVSATTFAWSTDGGVIVQPNGIDPYWVINESGTYTISLTANGPGGTDMINQSISITVNPGPTAQFTADNLSVTLPNAVVGFTNLSTQATNYFWDFGDANTSTDQHPWNQYSESGQYTVMLIAMSDGCINDTAFIEISVEELSGWESHLIQAIQTYPSPFEDHLTVQGLPADQSVIIQLTDINGRLLHRTALLPHITEHKITDLVYLAKGVYVLQILSDDYRLLTTRKVMK
jgi:spore germination protein YaaH/PKD repeat protein